MMDKRRAKEVKQRFFMAKELRLSISLIVIWSLLAGIIFTYLTKELGARIEHGVFSYIIVFLGYVIIVVVLALFFTHRFIGPFERLKMEMRLILTGNYHRRLSVRTSDDFYVRSFVLEVNKMLDEFERKSFDKEGFRKSIDSELLHIMALVEKENVSKDKLREALLSFHEKMESLLKKK
jgi:nitrogen fixation/metabolism regulation signal transduction histidine kinase